MSYTTHNLIQGSDAWADFRLQHDGASEIAAVLGLSLTTTRSELLRMKHSGIAKEFSDWVQENILDHGHAVEATARPHIEAIVGQDLYPVTCSIGRISASCDGLTMDDSMAMEHKQWSARLVALVNAGQVPPEHMPQCQQVLMVTGAEKLIFVVSDGTPENMVHVWVFPDTQWFERIRSGWAQFHEDLAAYTPPAAVVEAIGHTPETLPALRIEVTGMVTASNLAQYKEHALAVFAGINRELTTDQQFADAEKVVKWCGDVEDRLAAAKQHALSQTESIDALFRAIDDISAEARRTRLELDKLVKVRKDAVRCDILQEGVAALAGHIASLNQRLGKNYMPAIPADFAGAIKGKRSIDSLRDAVGTTLANAKIAASAVADRIQENLVMLDELGAGFKFLFFDLGEIVLKAPDDCRALAENRIAAHKAEELAKEEAQRERIRTEELARIEREQRQAAAAEELVKKAAEQKAEAERKEAIAQAAQAHIAIETVADSVPDATFLDVALQGEIVDAEVKPGGAPPLSSVSVVVPLLRHADSEASAPTLRLGQIGARLGFALTADNLHMLGFAPAGRDKAAVLYHDADFTLICAALIKHINQVQAQLAA